LLEVLVSNLVSNAVRHAPANSGIVIEGDKSSIKVCNAGAPLENPAKIFDRFHRESRTTLGNGLGLSIVKKICDVAGFAIDYRYAGGRHQFTIHFSGEG
jgi:K+-sensing histidine kinase KdpD